MRKMLTLSGAGAALAAVLLAGGLVAGGPDRAAAQNTPGSGGGGALDRAAVEQIVREYLLANPELMLEVQSALDAKQKEEQRLASLEVIRAAKNEIFNAPTDGVVGNPDGKITVVEFYDYNCGYCKGALDDMLALTATNPDLRFVLKEFPILGPDSQKAHVVSMAFRALAPEKYGEFHQKLLGAQGRAGEATAIKIATSLGVDEAALRAEMKNPSITEAFNQTYDLANRLAVTGTPSYVVGDEVLYGALGQETLSEKIAAAAAACTSARC